MFDKIVDDDKHIQILMSFLQIVLKNFDSLNANFKNLLKSINIISKAGQFSQLSCRYDFLLRLKYLIQQFLARTPLIYNDVFSLVPNWWSSLLKPHDFIIWPYKLSTQRRTSRGMHHVCRYQTEYDHHQVDQVLQNRCPVLSSAESWKDEENCHPYYDLVAHEHADRTHQEGHETGAVGLLLIADQLDRVVVHYIFWILLIHINNIISTRIANELDLKIFDQCFELEPVKSIDLIFSDVFGDFHILVWF